MATSIEFWITLGILLLSGGTAAFMARLERRPRQSLEPNLVPTTPLILLFGFIALLALVHLANVIRG